MNVVAVMSQKMHDQRLVEYFSTDLHSQINERNFPAAHEKPEAYMKINQATIRQYCNVSKSLKAAWK